MSLSRRFYGWLAIEEGLNLKLFIRATQQCIIISAADYEKYQKLFRVLTCILDNGTLTDSVLPAIVTDLIETSKKWHTSVGDESLISANQFFELADLSIIWNRIKCYANEKNDEHSLRLIAFALRNLKISEQSIFHLYLLDIVDNTISKFQVLAST